MTPPGARWRSTLAAVAVGLLAAWTAWWRLGPVARGTVWAEDGGLFHREHLALGSLGSLFHPYAGYLHLGPRLVVDAAFLLPVEWYALAVSATCCLLVGGVSAAVFVLARDVVPAWPLRLVLAAVPVLLPTAPWEVTGNAANLHTFGLFLAPWLFAHRARTLPGALVLALVTVLVVGTEAQAVLFLPLLLLSWSEHPADPARTVAAAHPPATGLPAGRRRSSRLLALPVTVAALVTGAAQVVTALTTERESAPGDPTARDVVSGFLAQTVGGLWRADVAAVGRAVVAHGWVVVAVPAVVLGVLLVLSVAVALRGGRRRTAVLVAALAVSSGVVWTAALVANASANGRWSRSAPASLLDGTPSRYAAAAGLLLTRGARGRRGRAGRRTRPRRRPSRVPAGSGRRGRTDARVDRSGGGRPGPDGRRVPARSRGRRMVPGRAPRRLVGDEPAGGLAAGRRSDLAAAVRRRAHDLPRRPGQRPADPGAAVEQPGAVRAGAARPLTGSAQGVSAQRNRRVASGVRGPSPTDTGSSVTRTIRDLIATRANRTQLPW